MTYFADLGSETLGIEGEAVRAIGWLDGHRSYPKGSVPAGLLPALARICAEGFTLRDVVPWWPFFRGLHECELCGSFRDSGDIAVPSGQSIFIAPAMIVHYIESHRYLPPADFVDAAMACPSPGSPEYAEAIAVAAGLDPSPALRRRFGWFRPAVKRRTVEQESQFLKVAERLRD